MKGEFCLASVLLFLTVTVSGQLEYTEVNEVTEKYIRSRRAYENTHANKWNIYSNDNNQTYYIPFVVQSVEGYDYMTELMEAFEDYNEYTCVQFRERTNETTYVTMKFVEEIPGHPEVCGLSTVGMNQVGNANRIWFKVGSAECNEKMVYIMRHELFHLVGFYHEHERPDRDDHVMDTHNNEERHTKVTDTDISPYDLFSVSNYYHFHDKSRNCPLGSGYGRLSFYDIKGINKAYKCVDRLTLGGCYNSDLPAIIGSGRLNTNNSIYQTMEGVRLICDPGYEVIGTQFSYCEGGSFIPNTLRCRKIRCNDKTSKCDQLLERNICDASRYPAKLCQQTCGFCDRACWTTPLLKGMVKPQKFNKFYLENDTISIQCQEGYYPITGNIATCVGGIFDIREFQCVRIIEGTVDEGRVEANVEKRCEPLDIEVGNGTLVPMKEYYENGDVIQLVCNEGFEPSSTSTAHCRTYGNWTGFHHAKLQCVERECRDVSEYCDKFKAHGMCNRTEMIGASRIYCQQTCGHCGLCKSMPTFDRDISSLSSQKMEYKPNEQVEIECFKGYRPITNISTCINGVFDPPHLLCIPDETSCISPPDIIETHSIYPRLQIYPSGQVINIRCGSIENGDFGYHVGKVTCLDGKFEPFSCPMETSCTMIDLERYIENMTECDGREYSYSPIEEIYLNNSEVEVYCDLDEELFVYCQDGSFVQPPDYEYIHINIPNTTYEYEDSGSGSGDEYYGREGEIFTVTITDHPCFTDDIDIYGQVVTPSKDIYEHGELISCSAHPEIYANCSNGDFDKKRLICYEDVCADTSEHCHPTLCSDPEYQENCRFTCGICERQPCASHNNVLRGRIVSPYHDWFRYGEVGEIFCENSKRIPITCGDRGKFDHDLFDPHMCTIDRKCENSFEFCSLFHDECHRSYLKRYCPGTCRTFCRERSLSSRYRST